MWFSLKRRVIRLEESDMTAIKAWLSGKKVYLTMVVAIIAAIIGFSEGALTTVETATAVWAAVAAVFFRAAITKSGPPAP